MLSLTCYSLTRVEDIQISVVWLSTKYESHRIHRLQSQSGARSHRASHVLSVNPTGDEESLKTFVKESLLERSFWYQLNGQIRFMLKNYNTCKKKKTLKIPRDFKS